MSRFPILESDVATRPGPADYSVTGKRSLPGGRFNMSRPKSYTDWQIYRAKTIPAPGEYVVDTGATNIPGGRFKIGRSKSTLEWEEYRSRRLPGPSDYFGRHQLEPTVARRWQRSMSPSGRGSPSTITGGVSPCKNMLEYRMCDLGMSRLLKESLSDDEEEEGKDSDRKLCRSPSKPSGGGDSPSIRQGNKIPVRACSGFLATELSKIKIISDTTSSSAISHPSWSATHRSTSKRKHTFSTAARFPTQYTALNGPGPGEYSPSKPRTKQSVTLRNSAHQ
eukprot:Rmarinus@m.18442